MDSQPTPDQSLLQMQGISKRFGRVTVLHEVDFELAAGEVHVLAGENGAGKSTLIKILAGVYSDYDGQIKIQGRPVRFANPSQAVDQGVGVIHQELSLIGSMSIADNLFLGRFKTTGGFVQSREQRAKARYWLKELEIDADPATLVERLPISVQQRLEIAKALSLDAKILVMDEPTSSLSDPEVRKLFKLIDELQKKKVGIIYISHKMDEIERIADSITVLRDGRLIESAPAAELPRDRLIQKMVGRELTSQFPQPQREAGRTRLEVKDFGIASKGKRHELTESVSFSVARGEVVGLGGLQGSGASELLLALFGSVGEVTGEVSVDGKRVRIGNPRDAIRHGIALLTADRKTSGLVLSMSIINNTTLASFSDFTTAGWLRPSREREAAKQHADALHLNAASLEMPVGALSGGNQQKVALAKWLQTHPKVLLLDEPTRGVDVGAKQEIYQLIDQWATAGMAILLISTEMPELLALSDRVLVMHRGQITARFDRSEATAERVLAAAMGSDSTMVEEPN